MDDETVQKEAAASASSLSAGVVPTPTLTEAGSTPAGHDGLDDEEDEFNVSMESTRGRGSSFWFARRSSSTATDTGRRQHPSASNATTAGGRDDEDESDSDDSDSGNDSDDDDSDSDGRLSRVSAFSRFSAVLPHRLSVLFGGGGSDADLTAADGAAAAATTAMPSPPHHHEWQATIASASAWGHRNKAERQQQQHRHHHHPPKHHGHHASMVGPALAHFRAKLQTALRTALAAGMATAISQFVWKYSHSLTWFSVTLAISGTRQSLGETLLAAIDFWKGAMVVLPFIYLLSLVRFYKALTLIGLFLSVVVIILYPGVTDAGKRMAAIFLTVVVLNCDVNPDVSYNDVVVDLLLTLAFANLFSVVALLLPLPLSSLALFDARAKVKTIRHRLGSILRGYDHTFGLGEEVHYSMIEQLLEETTQAVDEIKAELLYVKWEMILLRFQPAAHHHLTAYVEAVEKQVELFRGMRLSLRRMTNNATHQEFLKFLHKPLSNVLGACVAVSDNAARSIESELVVCECLRQRAKRRRYNQRVGRTHKVDLRPSMATGAGGHQQQHRRTASRAAPPPGHSRSYAEDLDSLFTIVETRMDMLMTEFVKARLAIIFGLKPAVDEVTGAFVRHPHPPGHSLSTTTMALGTSINGSAATATSTTTTAAPVDHRLTPVQEDRQQPTTYRSPSKSSSASSSNLASHLLRTTEGLELVRRRASGEAVYHLFTQDYNKLGYFNVLPRQAFLLDLCNYVKTLPVLVRACGGEEDEDGLSLSSSFSSSPPAAKVSWQAWGTSQLLALRVAYVEPVVALFKQQPARRPHATVRMNTAADSRASIGSTATTVSGTTASTSSSPSKSASANSSSNSSSSSHRHNHYTEEESARQKLVNRFRQPVKVALAVVLASIGILLNMGFATTWGVIAVCQALSSHPGSSFKSGYDRIQGTVLGGMYGIVVLDWLELDSQVAILLSLTVWVFFCSFNRMSSLYGEVAVVAAITAPVIMIGPIAGEQGAMIRIQQTILGTVIYVVIDNLCWPVRAKIDLRRELLTSLRHFRELWGLTFSIFLEKAADRAAATAQAQVLHDTLKGSFARQSHYIALAVDEPELWHKPFHATAYRKVLGSLSQVSLFMSMLIRASTAFPREVEERDRAMLASIQGAVQELEQVTAHALEEAWDAVSHMTERGGEEREEDGGVKKGYRHPLHAPGRHPHKRPQNNNYHRRKRTQAVPALTKEAAHAFALLRLGEVYTKIQDWVDVYFEEHIKANWAKDDLVIVSADLILSLNGMIFAIEALGQGLLRVGHAIRELVEREKSNYYRL